jgi:hypothetical protein
MKSWTGEQITGSSSRQLNAEFAPLAKKGRRLLAGKNPMVQAAVLGDLVATWIAGHRPDMREAALQTFLKSLPALIERNEHIMFGEQGWHE